MLELTVLWTAVRHFFLIGIVGWWSPIGSTRHCGHQWPIVLAPGDYDDGEFGGMIGRGNRSTRRKPASVPLCPTHTPHAARTRTRAAAVGSQCLTVWATARPTVRHLENPRLYRHQIRAFYVPCVWLPLLKSQLHLNSNDSGWLLHNYVI
jgi:hypothetical protein